jgi:hypothetical protein
MPEYKVITREVTSALSRDLPKAAAELARDVTAEMASGWKPQGGVASIQAGTSVYLLQALVKSN